ncbi:MAG: hypothetical protein ABIG87_00105 [Patescibacteria group bacterium]
MEPEDKKIIRENLEIAKESNKLIKKMRRSMLLGSISSLIYWIFIIGASLGAYYYFQPYLDSAKKAFQQIQTGAGAVSDGVTTTTQNTGKMIESVLDFGKNVIGL